SAVDHLAVEVFRKPELFRIDLDAAAVTAEIEAKDRAAGSVQGLGQFGPFLLAAILVGAQSVQQQHRGHFGVLARVEGAVQFDTIDRLETDLLVLVLILSVFRNVWLLVLLVLLVLGQAEAWRQKKQACRQQAGQETGSWQPMHEIPLSS